MAEELRRFARSPDDFTNGWAVIIGPAVFFVGLIVALLSGG